MLENVVDIGESPIGKAPRTKEHLATYCAVYLNNRFPFPSSDNPHCIENDHQSPFDAIWAAYAEIDPMAIWYAMRGSGKTYNLSILAWLESTFKPKCKTTVLGGSLEQSTKAVAYLNFLWDFWGSICSDKEMKANIANIKKKDLLVNGAVAGRGFKLTNGSEVQALAASPKSVRGPHPQKLRLDELDEMDEFIYNSAMGQPKANFGIKDNIVISSTLHHAFGLMTKVIDERERTGAKLFQWCVYDVTEPFGFWAIDEIARRKQQIPEEMWDSEYLLKRPQVGDAIYDFMVVDKAYRRGFNIDYEKEILTQGGIDWGYNCTVLHVVQDWGYKFTVPKSISWEYMELTDRCKEIIEYCRKYNIKTLFCDSNPKDANITLHKTIKEMNLEIKVIPIQFNIWKDVGISVIRYLLHKNLLDIKDKIFKDKLQQYHYKNVELEIIAKEDDHFPDAFCSWAATRWQILGKTLYNYEKYLKKELKTVGEIEDKMKKRINARRTVKNL
jgi:hypothetical protein